MSACLGMPLADWHEEPHVEPPIHARFIGGPFDGVTLGMIDAPEMVEISKCPKCKTPHAWKKSPAPNAVTYALTEHDEDAEPERARYEQSGMSLPKPRPGKREKVPV